MKGVSGSLRVAIIGAGISGLACAIELERHGITPDIFEQRHRVGELFTHSAVFLQIMNRPIRDPVDELRKDYGIVVEPLNKLKKIIMHAPNVTGAVTGNLGYLVHLGQATKSIACQLLAQIKSPVHYNAKAEYAALAREYDYVIVTTGNNQVAKILGCWQDVYTPWVMGATVQGSFDPCAMQMWLNTEYAKTGYAYLTPFNHKSATLALVVTGATRETIGDYWKRFWQVEKFDYQVNNIWDLQHNSGSVYPHQVGNILFAGNAGGFVEPTLGFALLAGIKSGVIAARAIVKGKSYEELLEKLKKTNRLTLPIRKSLNRAQNKDYDHLIALLIAPVIKQLTYNTNIDSLKIVASLLNIYDRYLGAAPKKIESGDRRNDP